MQGSTGKLSASSATSADPTSASRTPTMTRRQDPRHGEAGCCSFSPCLVSFLNALESCPANCGRQCQGERKISSWAKTCVRVSLNPSTAQVLTSCPLVVLMHVACVCHYWSLMLRFPPSQRAMDSPCSRQHECCYSCKESKDAVNMPVRCWECLCVALEAVQCIFMQLVRSWNLTSSL